MRTVSKNNVKLDDAPPLPTSDLPRSATGNVGLGLPSTRSKALFNQAPRSSSSRQALNHLSSSTTATTPRSASMNMLAHSNSRLGIAAHLVPPESTYTPPKGQAWDEVVLPTVAKKLGLGDGPSPQGWVEGDGDLAVEWDKSGTPVKWIKKETVSRLGGPGEASKAMQDVSLPAGMMLTYSVGYLEMTTLLDRVRLHTHIPSIHQPNPHFHLHSNHHLITHCIRVTSNLEHRTHH